MKNLIIPALALLTLAPNVQAQDPATPPVRLSDAENEYWYYMGFKRQNEGSTLTNVFSDNGSGNKVTTDGVPTFTVADDAYLWKFTGSYDACRIISKSGLEMFFNEDDARYVLVASGSGEDLTFEEETQSASYSGWGFLHPLYANYMNGAGVSPQIGHSQDHNGRAITFLPFGTGQISVKTLSKDLGRVFINETIVDTIVVSSVDLTSNIDVSQTESSAFSVSAASLPSTGDTLFVSYQPTVVQSDTVQIRLASFGVDTVTITITAKAIDYPVKFSSATDEYWYSIYFKMRTVYPKRVITNQGAGNLVAQVDSVSGDESQMWKCVGNKDNFQIVAKNDGSAFKYDTDQEAYITTATSAGDMHKIVFDSSITAEERWFVDNLTHDFRITSEIPPNMSKLIKGTNKNMQYLVFAPRFTETAIVSPASDFGDKIVTRYYNLQGIRVERPVQGTVYIRQEIYSRGAVTDKVVY
ncbi:MAG: hypothetical protein LBR66_03000 [Candidatus Symbiothrix sp.]|jgi:hypothetical protein|nr:hypothetical protein [Candidatus Symbiothrix sp.]